MEALYWIVGFVILLVIEALTYNLATIWFTIACIPVIIIASTTSVSLPWQLLIFACLSALLLFLTRPLVKKLKKKKNLNSMVGKNVMVVSALSKTTVGQVKTHNGVIWNAIPEMNETIEAQTPCVITAVEGNTLTVKKAVGNL